MGPALLVAAQFSAFVDRSLPGALAPQFMHELRLSDTQVGALQGPAFVALYAVAAIAALRATTSRHRLAVASVCILAWTAAAIGFALATSFAFMLGARLLMGAAQAVFAPCALAAIADAAPAERRARWTSTFTAGSAAGRSAAFLLAGAGLALAPRLAPGVASWRWVGLVLALPNLALAAALLSRGEDRIVAPSSGTTSYRPALMWISRHAAAAAGVVLAAAAAVAAVQSISAWGAVLLHRRFGVSTSVAALAFGAALLIAALAGHLGGGWLIDARRRSPAALLAAGLVTAWLGAAASQALGAPWSAGLALALAAFGASTAALGGMIAMQVMAPARLRGPLGALYLAAVSLIGFGAGPLLAGWFSDRGGADGAAIARSLTLVLALCALVGVGAVMATRGAWRRAGVEAAALG